MTSGTEMTRAAYRHLARDPRPGAGDVVAPVARVRPRPRWSRRRGVLGVFASFAAVGFVAAYVGPAGLSLSTAAPAYADPVTLYAETIDDAQSYATVAGPPSSSVERDGYTVYVTPKPTPTPTPQASASGGGASAESRPRYSGGGSPAEWMSAAGIAEADWGYVDYIVNRESTWNPNATNSSSGACGLVQAYPCSKVPGNGYDPVDNLRWGSGYAIGRYGSWAAAYDFWTRNHWW